MRYYVIGIGGVAMASLAGLLKEKGHTVAGSDSEMFYEPMRSVLQKAGIPVFTPYSEKNIARKFTKSDFVIVGNAISRGNPELEYVLSNGLRYRSVVDVLREEFIENHHSVVVTGTHGKTTTSALLAWILEYAKRDPSVFVGGSIRPHLASSSSKTDLRLSESFSAANQDFLRGVLQHSLSEDHVSRSKNLPDSQQPTFEMRSKNFEVGYKFGKGKEMVLEGDEYDTCFFDKNPKFLGYRPFIGIVNNIELDHVDIYRDFKHYQSAFSNFIKLIPQNGLLVINREDKNAWKLVETSGMRYGIWKNAEPQITSFGLRHGDYTAKNIRSTKQYLNFAVLYKGKRLGTIKTSLTGTHNVTNILAAIAAAQFLHIPFRTTQKAVALFEGVKRRAEVLGVVNSITIIDDYAHHPTAVATTLKGLRSRFAKRRIILLFEPGSASSRRRIFEQDYVAAFRNADMVFLYKPYGSHPLSPEKLFNGKHVAAHVRRAGTRAEYVDDIEKLVARIKEVTRRGDVVVIMSCRNFDGLRERILSELK